MFVYVCDARLCSCVHSQKETDQYRFLLGKREHSCVCVCGCVCARVCVCACVVCVCHRLVMITYLQHTHPNLPHYDDKEWDWLRGAMATVDR